jgi:Sensors of blue-light using FAD
MPTSQLRRVVYVSRTSGSLSARALLDLLVASRRANHALGVTGLLLHRRGTFLQLLDGPVETIGSLLGRLREDPRHHDLRVLVDTPIAEPWFPDWCMGFEEVDQVIPATWPGLTCNLQPAYSVEEWVERPDLALGFFDSLRPRPVAA